MKLLVFKVLSNMIEADIFLYEFGSRLEWLFAILAENLQNHLFKVFGNVFNLMLELDTLIDKGKMVFVDFFGELNSFMFVN